MSGHVTSDRVWQRALATVSEAASFLAATLGTSQPRCSYKLVVYIKTSCPSEKMLLIFVAILMLRSHVNSSPVESQRVLQLEDTQSNQPLLIPDTSINHPC